MMRHDQTQNLPQEMDTWLSSLVDAFEQVSPTDIGVVPCLPVSGEALLHGVLEQLARPAESHAGERATLTAK